MSRNHAYSFYGSNENNDRKRKKIIINTLSQRMKSKKKPTCAWIHQQISEKFNLKFHRPSFTYRWFTNVFRLYICTNLPSSVAFTTHSLSPTRVSKMNEIVNFFKFNFSSLDHPWPIAWNYRLEVSGPRRKERVFFCYTNPKFVKIK